MADKPLNTIGSRLREERMRVFMTQARFADRFSDQGAFNTGGAPC